MNDEVRDPDRGKRRAGFLPDVLDSSVIAEKSELQKRGLSGPAIVVITGMRKPWRTKFSSGDYKKVRRLGEAYKSTVPRSIAI